MSDKRVKLFLMSIYKRNSTSEPKKNVHNINKYSLQKW